MAGIGIRYAELARRLPRPGIEVAVITPGDPDGRPRRAGDARGRAALRARRPARRWSPTATPRWRRGSSPTTSCSRCPSCPRPSTSTTRGWWRTCTTPATLGLGAVPQRPRLLGAAALARRLLPLLLGGAAPLLPRLPRRARSGQPRAPRRRRRPARASSPWCRSACPPTLPPHRPWLPPRAAGERRILFGGLYDWYDPWTLLAALDAPGSAGLAPVPGPHAQRGDDAAGACWAEVEAWCRSRGLWETRVCPIDWVPEDRRFDLLRDVDLMVALHRPRARDPALAAHALARRARRRVPGDRERGRRGERACCARRRRAGSCRPATRPRLAAALVRRSSAGPSPERAPGRARARRALRLGAGARAARRLLPGARGGPGQGAVRVPARHAAAARRIGCAYRARALRRDVGGAAVTGPAHGRRRRAELERPPPPRDLPGRPRRPARPRRRRGRCSSSTTDRATAPRRGCAAATRACASFGAR